ncbi:MAG: pyrroline-5-carboxylate reductase [Lysobacteraceae bacterium]
MTASIPAAALPSANGPVAAIAFIGGGNMARSLIGGLLRRGFDPAGVRVVDPEPTIRAALAADFGVRVHAEAAAAAVDSTLWLLAVKPQVARTVCRALAALAGEARPLVLSIAAGITSTQIQRWLEADVPVIRAMPNTPALLGAGATGLFASAQVSAAQREQAEGILAAVGTTAWVDDEALIDVVTALSGSGPAYVFLLAEAMQAAAGKLGLPAEVARALAAQTCLGAGRMLTESGEDAAVLRARVTSPGGTTQAALETLIGGGFEALLASALRAAAQRGAELSRQADA